MSEADRRTVYGLLIVFLAIGLGLLIGSGILRSYDVWWHLEQGRDIISTGRIRFHDIYSHTAFGAYRPPQQWLFEVIQAGLYTIAGASAMVALRMVLLATTLGLLAVLLLRRNCSYLLLVGLLPVVASAGMATASCRPHIVLPIFLLAVAAIVVASRDRPKLVWTIPLLFVPWTNLHASFIMGLAFVGIWGVQRTLFSDPDSAWRVSFDPGGLAQSAGVMIACIAACAVNPIGPELLTYPIKYLPGGELAWHSLHVAEWQMPQFGSVQRMALLIVIGGGALTALFGWRRMTPFEVGILVLMMVLGVRWRRSDMQSAVCIAFVITPVVSQWLRNLSPTLMGFRPDSDTPSHRILPVALVLVAAVGVFAISRPVRMKPSAFGDMYPDEMTSWILTHELQGNMYNPMRWGGYLIHHLYPRHRVFIDGRIDMYPREVFDDFLDIRNAEGDWKQIAKKRGVEWGLTRRAAKLFDVIKTDDEWAMVFETDTGGVFVRLAGPNGHLTKDVTGPAGFRPSPPRLWGQISQNPAAYSHPARETASPRPGGMSADIAGRCSHGPARANPEASLSDREPR